MSAVEKRTQSDLKRRTERIYNDLSLLFSAAKQHETKKRGYFITAAKQRACALLLCGARRRTSNVHNERRKNEATCLLLTDCIIHGLWLGSKKRIKLLCSHKRHFQEKAWKSCWMTSAFRLETHFFVRKQKHWLDTTLVPRELFCLACHSEQENISQQSPKVH